MFAGFLSNNSAIEMVLILSTVKGFVANSIVNEITFLSLLSTKDKSRKCYVS